ncbi:MAG: SWIM zinc finger family protein [Dehalococcoidia bacterium]
MHSSLIGKIEKAKLYAQEPERVTFSQFRVTFRGEHSTREVSLDNGQWSCQCSFFGNWNTCSHIMALERILDVMLPQTSPVSAKSS